MVICGYSEKYLSLNVFSFWFILQPNIVIMVESITIC